MVLWPLKMAAAEAPPKGGITVAPALLTTQVGSKQTQTSATIGIRNNFEVPVTVTAELNGFDVRNNALVPTINAEKNLAGVVTLSPTEIVIEPGSSKNITVSVHDTPGLSPGGHYLSILLTEAAVNSSLGTSQLSLRPAVSATLYVIKEDGAVRRLQAQSFKLKHSLFSLPQTADITFSNPGNVAVIPRGSVRLQANKLADGVIAQGIINQASAPVFPQATITLQSQLRKLSTSRWPGRYQAVLEYRYDGQESTQQLTTSFWYIPKLLPILLLFLITVVTLGLWPTNRRNIRRWWRRVHRSKSAPYMVPDPAKINQSRHQSEQLEPAEKQSVKQRRKIDDVKKL